jgi:hypothetical protein
MDARTGLDMEAKKTFASVGNRSLFNHPAASHQANTWLTKLSLKN